MKSSALAAGVRRLRDVMALQGRHADNDEQLLHAFISQRDDSAFAALVRRYGPLVLGVCRRVLHHAQDAEDAFQATFLLFARHAATLRNKSALPSWLHGAAFRVAMTARRSAARRRTHERRTPARPSVDPSEELHWREMQSLLDEEIARLPEIYRSVFVVCCLENVSREEAARRLGVKPGTVSSRLTEARKRLAQRLARRGVDLTALLAASTLMTQPASALSPVLIASTIEAALGEGKVGLVSAHVAALVKSTASVAVFSKTKIVTAVLLTVSVLAGVGAWTASASRLRLSAETPPTSSKPRPTQANARPRAERGNDESALRQEKDVVTVKGRVLDPDGKPVNGARLYSVRAQSIWPRNDAVVELAQRDPTGADGRFHVTAKRPGYDELVYLIAHAAGFGVNWIDLSEGEWQQEATLRLPQDVPIAGRVVNTEGRPVAGVSVSVAQIWASANEKLDDYLAGWLRDFLGNRGAAASKQLLIPLDGVLGKTKTDKDGRFVLLGIGRERIVHVAFSGSGVARTTPWIITRPGFDTKPYNAVLGKAENEAVLKFNRFPGLFPPSFTFIAEAGRLIEGTVKDAATGKPLTGCRLLTQTSYGHGTSALSDAEGKYHLDGLAKRTHGHYVSVRPPKGTAYLGRSLDVADTFGWTPLRLDIELAQGAVVTGRVLDRQTGKPVRCYIYSVPLTGNKFFGFKPGFDSRSADGTLEMDEDGRFRLAAIPGKMLLIARVLASQKLNGQPLYVYRRAVPDPDHKDVFLRSGDSWGFRTASGGFDFLDIENGAKVVEAPDKGETRAEMVVDRGTTVRIAVQDADGRPLAGAWVAGLTDTNSYPYKLPEARATVYGLNPQTPRLMPFFQAIVDELSSDKPRALAFFHAEKKLGGTAIVRGDEKGPVVVELSPLGKVSGRLLDGDGNPLEGVEVSIRAQSKVGHELYRFAAPSGKPVRTDKDGRFRIEDVVPNLKFGLGLRRERTFFVGEPRIGVRQVRPGETLDVGAVRVKPAG